MYIYTKRKRKMKEMNCVTTLQSTKRRKKEYVRACVCDTVRGRSCGRKGKVGGGSSWKEEGLFVLEKTGTVNGGVEKSAKGRSRGS